MKGLTGDDTLTNLKLENMLEFLRKIFRSEKNTLKVHVQLNNQI